MSPGHLLKERTAAATRAVRNKLMNNDLPEDGGRTPGKRVKSARLVRIPYPLLTAVKVSFI